MMVILIVHEHESWCWVSPKQVEKIGIQILLHFTTTKFHKHFDHTLYFLEVIVGFMTTIAFYVFLSITGHSKQSILLCY